MDAKHNSGQIRVLDWQVAKTLSSKLRDRSLPTHQFRNYAKRLCNLLWEFVLSSEPSLHIKSEKHTPSGTKYDHFDMAKDKVAIVTILRAAEAMIQESVLYCEEDFQFVKMVVQRGEKDHFFFPLPIPSNIKGKLVFVADCMVGTGGSFKIVIDKLIETGIEIKDMRLVCLYAGAVGIEFLQKTYPGIIIYGVSMGEVMDERRYLEPGVGDFGDRFFNTPCEH